MMFRTHYGETVTVVLAMVMGLIMAIAAIIVDHLAFHYSNVFKIWSMITMVVLVVSILHDWPIMFVVSYLGAFVAEAVGVRVANRYCRH